MLAIDGAIDGYYVACLTDRGDHWSIIICNKPCGIAPTLDEAEEVVRMWAGNLA